MTVAEITARTESFVRETFLYARPDFVLEPDYPLLGNGVIDSMGVMELLAFLEEGFGLTMDDDEITEENLGSVAAIVHWVASRRGAREPMHAA